MIEKMIRRYDDIHHVDLVTREFCIKEKWSMGAFIALFDKSIKKVLLVKLGEYGVDSEGGYPWNLPGGGVELNELPSAAVTRELSEETSINSVLELNIAGIFERPNYHSKRYNKKGELIILFCSLYNDTNTFLKPGLSEIQECNFFEFQFYKWLKLPSKGKSKELPAPIPKHWVYWIQLAHHKLNNKDSAPLIHIYENTLDEPLYINFDNKP